MEALNVKINRLAHAKDLTLPSYATADSAGMDLCAAIEEEIIVNPNERILGPTGLTTALPRGFEGQVRPRSGLAAKNGLTVLNTPGTIDSDYRGEIKVILINLGESTFIITRGMRIAQLIIAPVTRVEWQEVTEPLDSTERSGGFGSTGLHVA